MKLLNWKCSNITTHNPLLYIHGSFEDENEDAPEFITCGSRQWPVVDGQFKCFNWVKQNVNTVEISWNGDKQVSVDVDYVKNVNKRYIQPVYIVCTNSNGSFMAPEGICNTMDDAIQTLQFNVRLMQVFFEESLYENGFEKKTFNVAQDENGQPDFKIMISDLDIDDTLKMTPDQLYSTFHKELSEKFGQVENCKYVCFMSCTRYFPPVDEDSFTVEKIMSYVKGHAALGGGRLALFGTGSLHTWASSLDDLGKCFKDDRMIDRKKLFDDSCGRGTYWANYSTTLGATIHELGHCFDLAHTRHGIMSRGHDDMNYFYTVVKGQCKKSQEKPPVSKCVEDSGKYKGAHWYRSSAVILDHHKWLNPHLPNGNQNFLTISLHPDLMGPFGSLVPRGTNNNQFNSKEWLVKNGFNKLVGLVFYYEDYLEGIQFQGVKETSDENGSFCSGDIIESGIYGNKSAGSKKYVFQLTQHEYFENINIRCGAWIDAIQLTTNLKSTPWLGGMGGDLCKTVIPSGKRVVSWFGTSHDYVGSIGIFIESEQPTRDVTKKTTGLTSFTSKQPIVLLEIYDPRNGEVTWYREYEDAMKLEVDLLEIMKEKGYDSIEGSIWDASGNHRQFSFSKNVFNFLTSHLLENQT